MQQTQQTQQQMQHASLSDRKGRCAEVCMDLLAMETARFFSGAGRQGGSGGPLAKGYGGPPTAAALEAMGIRVGKQLAER